MEPTNKVNCLILADMHWGAIDPVEFQRELDSAFFGYVNDLVTFGEQLDYIIIAGDLFDTKEAFSSSVVKEVISFIAKLLWVTEPCDTEIIIMEGTRTHDNLQLDNLAHIFTCGRLNPRVTVYSTVQHVYLKDASVLLIPEEYVTDQESYYSKFFKDEAFYDMIIGHGMVDKIWYAKKDKDSQNSLTKHMSAPVFKVDDLLDHCTKCYFGHVHMNKAYGDNNRFTYIGPYTNWEFGKSTKVGFYHVTINMDSGIVEDRYIENHLAKNYPTVAFKITENISLTDLNDKVDTVIANVYATTKNVGKVRLIVTLPKTIENWQSMKDFLIGKCGEIPNLKFILQLDDIESTENADNIESDSNYLFDHTVDIYQRIQTFIKNKSGRDIPLDTIKKYLTT